MTGARPSTRAGLAALAVVLAGLTTSCRRHQEPPPTSAGVPGGAAPSAAAATPVRGAPLVELDEQGALLKVSHQDPSGRIPLEYVETPEGTVTVRRTFDAGGRLLKEEAFRGDQPVPLPPPR